MLLKKLKSLILQQGYIPLDLFLELVIMHYYQHNQAIGLKGDFITAPEISQLFGEIIGICATLQQQYFKKPINLIELGPGKGTLMNDLLRGTKNFSTFHSAIEQIYLMEISEHLREQQQQNLKLHLKPLQWFTDITQLPQKCNIIIANEFFDALPIKQYKTINGKVYEVCVTLENSRFAFVDILSNLPPFNKPFIELCPLAISIAHQIAITIKHFGGVAIIIDYGYITPPSNTTLQALKNHHYINPLTDIGSCDITALVDFSALNQVFECHDLDTQIMTQGEFLRTYGIEARAQQLIAHGADMNEINSEINRLTNADQMGELFKVLIVRKIL